jgi:hypothetical protein
MMSLPNSAVYIQFHPLTYLVKLHIEMNIADLISKIVKATNQLDEYRTNKHHGAGGLPQVTPNSGTNNTSSSSKPSQVSSSSFSRGTIHHQHLPYRAQRMDSIDLALHGFAVPNWGSKESGPSTLTTSHEGYEVGPDLEAGAGGGGSEKKDFETIPDEREKDEGVDVIQQATQSSTTIHDVEKSDETTHSKS